MNEKCKNLPGLSLCLKAVFFLILLCTTSNSLKAVTTYADTLPILSITTNDGLPITDKTTYKAGTLKIQGSEKFKDEKYLYDGNIQIKGRGNTSWSGFKTKKPFKIKLESKSNLLNLGKSKQWVLVNNYDDKSLMRFKIVTDFSKKIGLYTLGAEFVEVYFNGEYFGNYILTEAIRIESGRIDIFGWEDAAESAADAIAKAESFSKTDKSALEDYMKENLEWVTSDFVTYNNKTYKVSDYYDELPKNKDGSVNLDGGWLIESCHHFDSKTKFYSPKGTKIMPSDPEYMATNTSMLDACQTFIKNFEDALYSEDGYTTVDGERHHYTDYADIESFCKYYMIQGLFVQTDALGSQYMYRDLNGKLCFGPEWDFNNSCRYDPAKWYLNSRMQQLWPKQANKDPYFVTKNFQYYKEIQDFFAAYVADGGTLDQYAALLKPYADKEYKNTTTFANDVASVKSFLSQRLAFINSQTDTVQTLAASLGSIKTSPAVSVKATDTGLGSIEITVDANYASAKKVGLYINGILRTVIDGQSGKYELDDPDFLDEPGSYNCVQAWAMDENENIISGLTNFDTFINKDVGRLNVSFDNDTYILNVNESIPLPWKVKIAERIITDRDKLANLKIQVSKTGGFEKDSLKDLAIIDYSADNKLTAKASGIVQVIASINESTARATFIIPGDINRDGRISAFDARMLAKYVRHLKLPTQKYDLQMLDMNKDGVLTRDDMNLLIKAAG